MLESSARPRSARALLVVVLVFTVAGCSDSASDSSPEVSENRSSDASEACVPQGEKSYTDAEIDYFTEVTGGSEYGDNEEEIRKWTEDVGIKTFGSPTPEDRDAVQSVVNELDNLISPIDIRLVDENPSIEIYFVPQSEFEEYELNDLEYEPGNKGFFWVLWKDCKIHTGRVLVSSEGLTQTERSHLIREELTQSFGLMHDSKKCEDSIFQQEWTTVTSYAPIDKEIIEALYRPEVKPCMSDTEVARVLRNLEK